MSLRSGLSPIPGFEFVFVLFPNWSFDSASHGRETCVKLSFRQTRGKSKFEAITDRLPP